MTEEEIKQEGRREYCEKCGQEIRIKVGINNWRNLFRKPTLNDWIMLFMIFMILVAAWAYNHDVGVCKDFIKNIDMVCMQRATNNSYNYNPYRDPNITGLIILTNLTTHNSSNITR